MNLILVLFYEKGQYSISSLRSSGEQARYIREKRSSTSVFESIARETGGTVYEINVSEVEDIVEKEIKVYENRVLKHLKAIHSTRRWAVKMLP